MEGLWGIWTHFALVLRPNFTWSIPKHNLAEIVLRARTKQLSFLAIGASPHALGEEIRTRLRSYTLEKVSTYLIYQTVWYT
jgi:hypothetical protein